MFHFPLLLLSPFSLKLIPPLDFTEEKHKNCFRVAPFLFDPVTFWVLEESKGRSILHNPELGNCCFALILASPNWVPSILLILAFPLLLIFQHQFEFICNGLK